MRQTLYEQEVEDTNAIHKIDNHLARKLIVMPLTSEFNPNIADAMHGKVQYGDKCSLPTSLGRLIGEKRYEVPWLFEIKPVRDNKSKFKLSNRILKLDDIDESSVGKDDATTTVRLRKPLDKAYISPLDFRSPENYIFLPKWLMCDLGVSPNDQVDISFVRIRPADLVVFQPLSAGWDELLETADPKKLLEHEINKYSSLTAGTTIFIEINGKEYPIYVKETIAEGGLSVHAVCVQDADIRTDIDRSIVDKLIKQRKESEAF